MTFFEKLHKAIETNNSLLCVGLDPDPERLPVKDVLNFNRAIIDATQDVVCAYKPNLAFYEALGPEGLTILQRTREHIPPHIPVIGDGKRGDIGSTARAYARGLFEVFAFDATTVSPYLGYDSVEPFLGYRSKGVFVLCRTSNPGAVDFQDLPCSGDSPLYQVIADKAREWNRSGNVGLVIGATYPEELRTIRTRCPDMWFLVPGLGTQGGEVSAAVRNGVDRTGSGAVFNVSRQVLYASRGNDFAAAARHVAEQIRAEINTYRGVT